MHKNDELEALEGKPTLDSKALAAILRGIVTQMDKDPAKAKDDLKELQRSVLKFSTKRDSYRTELMRLASDLDELLATSSR